MPHQKNGNMYAHKNFGLKVQYVGLVATLKQNQTRLIAFVDISNLVNKEYNMEKESTFAYVVTRCEEYSDYVEKVFFDEEKAKEYCNQFNGNENEYTRHITKVTL